MKSLCKEVPAKIAIQGNFDPDLLYAPKEVIERTVQKKYKEMKQREGWIVNLGHGIKPDMSVESVQVFIDSIHEAACLMSPH